MRSNQGWVRFLVLGLLVFATACAQEDGASVESETPAPAPEVVASEASFMVPEWTATPEDQPEGYEGPLPWDAYLQGRKIEGDFNGDGTQDTAILFEREPSDDVLEADYGDRAQEVKAFVREFGLHVFFSSDAAATPILVMTRVGGVGLYGIELLEGGGQDEINFVKYDSSNNVYGWNESTSMFEETETGD